MNEFEKAFLQSLLDDNQAGMTKLLVGGSTREIAGLAIKLQGTVTLLLDNLNKTAHLRKR